MKNKNALYLLLAGAAYWYFFMYLKKEKISVSQPGFADQPGQPGTSLPQEVLTAPAITTESSTIANQIKQMNDPQRELEYKPDDSYQNFYVNQVNGVKRMGVPYTI